MAALSTWTLLICNVYIVWCWLSMKLFTLINKLLLRPQPSSSLRPHNLFSFSSPLFILYLWLSHSSAHTHYMYTKMGNDLKKKFAPSCEFERVRTHFFHCMLYIAHWDLNGGYGSEVGIRLLPTTNTFSLICNTNEIPHFWAWNQKRIKYNKKAQNNTNKRIDKRMIRHEILCITPRSTFIFKEFCHRKSNIPTYLCHRMFCWMPICNRKVLFTLHCSR